MVVHISTYCYTNKGSRNHNEDYYDYFFKDGNGVFVVADGLGGHKFGEVASKFVTEFIMQRVQKSIKFADEELLLLIEQANTALIEAQRLDLNKKDMRTTLVCGIIKDKLFKYFNVGDSRLYYFKNGCLYRQTKDHSVSQVAVSMGEISMAEIRMHDDRNKLLKVIGNEEKLNINKIEPSILMEKGDAFLLCSDGFWEYVYETEMELDLVKSLSPEQWCEYMLKRLMHRVTNNNDNFTVICAFIN